MKTTNLDCQLAAANEHHGGRLELAALKAAKQVGAHLDRLGISFDVAPGYWPTIIFNVCIRVYGERQIEFHDDHLEVYRFPSGEVLVDYVNYSDADLINKACGLLLEQGA